MTLGLAVTLLIAGGLATWRSARTGGPYRAGPWPGLTPNGASVLLGCALLLAGGQLILAKPITPLPDLPVLAAFACAPLALATRLTKVPGAAAAVCGAYLLPRSLLSLLDRGLEPPPLLLVPAMVFDLSLWLRANDLANLWPNKQKVRRKHHRGPRKPGLVRASIAGGLFGLTTAALERPFVVLLGADPATWSGSTVLVATAVCAAICALLGLSVPNRAGVSCGRDRES